MSDNLATDALEEIDVWCEYTKPPDHGNQGDFVKYVRADLVPMWKDAPDDTGVWLVDGGFTHEFYVEAGGLWSDDIDSSECATFEEFVEGSRWFGPIPEDQ